jgi:hypothetical protein
MPRFSSIELRYERVISFKLENNFNNISKFISYRTKTHCVFMINTNNTTPFGKIIAVDPEKIRNTKCDFLPPKLKHGS